MIETMIGRSQKQQQKNNNNNNDNCKMLQILINDNFKDIKNSLAWWNEQPLSLWIVVLFSQAQKVHPPPSIP